MVHCKRQLPRNTDGVPKTNILWVSRHSLTEQQTEELTQLFGPFNLLRYPDTVSCAEQICELGRGCDVIAVVLPFNILVSLVELIGDEKIIIKPCMQRIEGQKENQQYKHLYWERILEAKLVTEKLEIKKG